MLIICHVHVSQLDEYEPRYYKLRWREYLSRKNLFSPGLHADNDRQIIHPEQPVLY